MIASTRLAGQGRTSGQVRMFSPAFRIAWAVFFVVTIWCEIAPRSPSLPPLPYYSYTAGKAVLFLLVGFLSPLTFWRFDSLGLGLLFSALAAGAVEGVQSVSEGHRGSYLEFGAKLVLLFIGFAFALSARYDRGLRLGPWHLSLIDSHRVQAAERLDRADGV